MATCKRCARIMKQLMYIRGKIILNWMHNCMSPSRNTCAHTFIQLTEPPLYGHFLECSPENLLTFSTDFHEILPFVGSHVKISSEKVGGIPKEVLLLDIRIASPLASECL